MKLKLLPFEILLAIQVILRAIFPQFIDWKLSLGSFLVLFILKGYFEGFRLYWVIFLIAGILSAPPLRVLQFIAIILVLFAIIYYPVYQNLEPSGPYKVGYREIWLNNGNLHVSVYYPTNEKGPDALQFTGRIPVWKNFHEICRLAKANLPEWYNRISVSYLNHRKLGVNSNVAIIQDKGQGFPVIVFSHGLGINRNSYSFYLKEWASNGYIVLTADHSDIVYPPSGELNDFAHRNLDLKKRLVDLQILVNFVVAPNGLCQFFGEHIKIDETRISAIGHSFGACSVAYLTLVDSRITGACVCMDPWYFALDEDLYKSLNKPLLIISTEQFNASLTTGNKEKCLCLAKANKEFSSQTIVCSFEGNCHNNLADNGLFMAREMSSLGILSKVELIEKLYRNNAFLIESFLDLTVLERKGAIKRVIIEKYKLKKCHPEIKLIEEDLN